MEEEYLKKITITVLLAVLAVLVFFVIKPIILSIILGIITAVIFAPMYDRSLKMVKSKNLAASMVTLFLVLFLLLIVFALIYFFTGHLLNSYESFKQVDFITPITTLFPSLASNPTFLIITESIIESSLDKFVNSILSSLTFNNFIIWSFQFVVFFFTFYFVIRDKDNFANYTKSILPFPQDITERLFTSSRDITFSVIYGQIVIGAIQGLIVGISFFILGIKNAFLLTILAILAGIFPIIGTTIVWLPVAVYLIVAGNNLEAVIVSIFGVISNFIDNILRPIFVSRLTKMHPLPVLIGMIGGFLLFGLLGGILGPLIIAYGFIMLEVYRGKNIEGVFIREN